MKGKMYPKMNNIYIFFHTMKDS